MLLSREKGYIKYASLAMLDRRVRGVYIINEQKDSQGKNEGYPDANSPAYHRAPGGI